VHDRAVTGKSLAVRSPSPHPSTTGPCRGGSRTRRPNSIRVPKRRGSSSWASTPARSSIASS